MQTTSLVRIVAACLAFVMSAPSGAAQSASVIVIPTGANIAVRLIDAIDSQKGQPTAEYRATVDDAVIVDGLVVVPVGAKAWLRTVSIQGAGALSGRVTLSLKLVAIEIDGKAITVHTGDATIQSSSQAANTAKKSVGGAILGGVVGGLLGGVDGAVSGAAAGAGAGAVVAMATGPQVRVPKETRLSFTLTTKIVQGARPESLSGDVRAVFDEILRIEARASALAQTGDWLGIDGLLDPAFTASINGQAISRPAFLAGIRPQPELVSTTMDALSFRLDGDEAVLSGVAILQVRRGSITTTLTQRFTDRFLRRRDSTWLVLRSDVIQ